MGISEECTEDKGEFTGASRVRKILHTTSFQYELVDQYFCPGNNQQHIA